MEKLNWILIRGLARESGHWLDFPQKIQQLYGGEVVCLELPGMGSRSMESSALSIRENTLDLRKQFVKKREQKKRWACLAISMGGMIALDWLSRFEDDFEGLALINTSASNFSLPIERMRPNGMKFILKLLAEKDAFKREKKVVEFMTDLRGDRSREVARTFSELEAVNPLQLKNVSAQVFASARFKAPEAVNGNLLFLIGNQDALVNPVCSMKLAAQYRAPVKVHESGGHDLALQDPDWVLAKLAEWLPS